MPDLADYPSGPLWHHTCGTALELEHCSPGGPVDGPRLPYCGTCKWWVEPQECLTEEEVA